VPSRACRVSFVDFEGVEHAVEVSAESLYEAVVLALAEFRRCGFAEVSFGLGTKLSVKVKAPETEHVVSVGKLQSWLEGATRSPKELLVKKRLKAMLEK
jgi:hypothetical protein